ncbi:hypothetical protein NV379_13435 [Paenibacillus sp. N1-5-1-14]|uniref:hypothetical protein n=1 Tax=Paenibacillus radicibacter TaxID=2972488 RepID=UPI002158C5F5|nr:hypothetical protein [Paenibacillus radicibacter]MCR8643654.1 hypothetical protein [Paenibacillus radicibacter]
MDTILLSIEELIYSFYSEGYFENGNGLRHFYMKEVTEEQMELLLQAACRSLLAKDMLQFQNHKFELRKDIEDIIAALNFSHYSIKSSKHAEDGEEDSVSYHVTDKGIYEHSLLYEGQVHVFKQMDQEHVAGSICEFFGVTPIGEEEIELVIDQAEFDQIIHAIDEETEQSEAWLDEIQGQQKEFVDVLRETKGYMNTMVILEMKDNKDPKTKDAFLFTTGKSNPWIITRVNDSYVVRTCTQSIILSTLHKHLNEPVSVVWR